MRTLIKDNFIFIVYVTMQIVVVILSLFPDEIIGSNYKVGTAIFYHIFGLVFFIMGYIIVIQKVKKKVILRYQLKNTFLIFSLICILIGIYTSYATISTVVSPSEYFDKLFSASQEVVDIRTTAGEEGLSGIFKMLNYLPLGVFLIASSYLNFLNFSQKDRKTLIKVKRAAMLGSIIKVVFLLDRLTILAILLVMVYENLVVKKMEIKSVVLIIGIIIVLSMVTSSRMSDTSVFDFLIVYFKLSIVNYQLMVDHYNEWTFGFNTFLTPFATIMRFFGINKELPNIDYWVWNPAQYFNSYLYMDFGLLSMLIYFFLGFFIRRLQYGALNSQKFYVSIYMIILFAVNTFISVPIIRATEFWVMIVLAILCNKYIRYQSFKEN